MAEKWHVNNENEVHPCNVTVKECQFKGSPHFEAQSTALTFAEMKNEMESGNQKFAVLSKEEKSETDQAPVVNASAEEEDADEDPFLSSEDEGRPHTYDVLKSRAAKVRKSIEKANRRLERAGIEDKFELKEEPYEAIKTKDGGYFQEDRVKIELNYPKLSYNGYEFQARVEKTESGKFVAYSSPGVELSGWRPTSMECEHCHKNISRSKVYAVKDADGNMKTVGGKCVELYTGLKPTNLWALEYDIEDDLRDQGTSPSGEPSGQRVERTKDLLSIAYVLTKDSGYHNAYSENPTSKSVSEVLYPQRAIKPTPEEIEWARQKREEAENVDIDQIKEEVKEAIKNSDNDWANNLRILMDEEYVNGRGRGTVISAMAALHKYRAKKEQKPWTKGFLGEKGEKVSEVKAKVVKSEKAEESYGYNTSYVTKLTMQTEDGHKVFWKTASDNVPEKGDNIVFNATIKDTSTWRDIDSTRVIRAKWTPLQPSEESGE